MKNKQGHSKLLGDAGEHFALSQFSFANKYAAKMPDNWTAYDLAVETGNGLERISVKTRSETKGWKNSKWFIFDERKQCDWYVFIFKSNDDSIRSWIIPSDISIKNANNFSDTRKNKWEREISWAKLNKSPLLQYENNWKMLRNPDLDK